MRVSREKGQSVGGTSKEKMCILDCLLLCIARYWADSIVRWLDSLA